MAAGERGDLSSIVGENYDSYPLGYPARDNVVAVEGSVGSNATFSFQSALLFERSDQQTSTAATHDPPDNFKEVNPVLEDAFPTFDSNIFHPNKSDIAFTESDVAFKNDESLQFQNDMLNSSAIPNENMTSISDSKHVS
jgi:hypothetical protein